MTMDIFVMQKVMLCVLSKITVRGNMQSYPGTRLSSTAAPAGAAQHAV